MTVLATIFVLSVLILVHEFGHYFAARSVDIEVPRFSLGLGPRVWGFRVGETEFVLSALPLGGYVKMAGLEEGAEIEGGTDEVPRPPSPRDFDAKPLWARAWVVSAGVIMNLLFALLVFIGLAFAYGERIDPTRRVAVHPARASTPELAPLAQIPFGATITAVGEQPIQSWDQVQRAMLRSSGRPLTLHFADAPPVTFTPPTDDRARGEMLRALRPLHDAVIGVVETGAPAYAAGIRPGDRIVAADGRPLRSWSEFEETIRASPGRPLRLDVERGAERLTLTATPAPVTDLDMELQRVPIGRLGVSPRVDIDHRPLGFGESVARGAQATWGTSAAIVGFLGDLITGNASPRNLGGPLAIGQLSGQAARFGFETFLNFMALLSINLAILNLLPIPILDGGHLMFMGIEAVRGRPLSLEQRMRLSHVGLIVVVGIMVWAMTNDVLRFFGI